MRAFLCQEPHGEWREELGDSNTWEVGSKGAGESALVVEADDSTVFLRAV